VRSLWTGSTGTWLRVGMVGLGLTIAVAEGRGLDVLPWALLVLMVDVATGGLLAVPEFVLQRREAFTLVLVGAALAGGALWIGTSPAAGAFCLLLVPAFRAGETFGRLAALLMVGVGAGVGMLGTAARGQLDAVYLTNSIQWCGLALLIGVLGAWSTFLREQGSTVNVTPSAAREAAILLRRLETLAGSIDGGFDAPASAELMLDALDAKLRSTRRGVLVGFGDDPAVPLALRGAERTPWDDPTGDIGGVLGAAWHDGRSGVGLRSTHEEERALMAVVLRDASGGRIGVMVLDRSSAEPFSAAELAAAVQVAELHSANLDVALIFAALRERAGYEERERLAREMHDGIAQELVALGYRIDVMRRQSVHEAPEVTESLQGLRTDLSAVLADLRLRIADLRIAVRPDQGLGAVVGARLQRFGSSSGLAVVLRLNESGFRLPAHIETLIYRLILEVLADARHAPGATSVDLTLDVAAPQAFLRLVHDGISGLRAEDFVDHPLTALGASIVADRNPVSGFVLQMDLRQRHSTKHASLTSERIPQRS
jgi:signal transduction histidine kinase